MMQNTIKDEYNNDILFIPINAYLSGPGKISLKSLEIRYNYSFTVPDLSSKLTEYIKNVGKDEISGDKVKVTLRFESDTNGDLHIKNLKVRYATPSKTQQYPEIICLIGLGIILIILGILIKVAPFKRETPKEPEIPDTLEKKQKPNREKMKKSKNKT
jgi:hypothetical protein